MLSYEWGSGGWAQRVAWGAELRWSPGWGHRTGGPAPSLWTTLRPSHREVPGLLLQQNSCMGKPQWGAEASTAVNGSAVSAASGTPHPPAHSS